MDLTTSILSHAPDDQESPILIDTDRPGRTICWRQYASAVRAIAAGLEAQGLEYQDCVALLSENDIYYHTVGHGVVAAGGIFCPMQTSDKVAEVLHQLRAASVKWLFASSTLLDLALDSARAAGLSRSRVLLYDPPGLEAASSPQPRLSQLLSTDSSQWRNPNIGKDPASITAMRMFSSGTTGSPKAANISHAALVAQMRWPDFKQTGAAASGIRILIYIPIYHSTSILAYNSAISGTQTTCVTAEKGVGDALELYDLIRGFKITTILLPPRFLQPFTDCVRGGTRQADEVGCLQVVFTGGSMANPVHVYAFQETFPNINFRVGYGTTEAGPVCTIKDTKEYLPGRVGKPFPGVEVKIIDPETLEEVPRGEMGEVCARSIYNFSGYNDNPAANATSILRDSDGNWFRTGDQGYFDVASAQIALTGRYKDIFKVAYKEVSPDEVEGVLMQMPAVEDAAVTSVPARHDANELEVRVYIVRKSQSDPITAHDVAAYVANKLSQHKVPTGGVIFCDHIPRNAMKKVVRRKLEDLVALEGSAERLCIEN